VASANDFSPVKRALVEVRELRARLAEADAQRRGPIAVVGIGVRFPGGVSDLEGFWDLLHEGRDGITEIPRERWELDSFFDADPDAPGRMYTRHGGFVDAVDQFDPHVFGISPREAAAMDPQHRLLLEVAWEALEEAGIAPDSLSGTATGVFFGLSNSDYQRLVFADASKIDTYASLGVNPSVAAGRLSYLLGLQGPSLVVDTACSSSLVAMHLACQSLRVGESSAALVGGVNVMLLPEVHVNFCKARMLAPDGRCKTFDAAADGYVRSEGCGVVVLKRLADALAAGDRIRAVIRGTAVNQDGRSSGLTAPNGPSQEAVIRAALENAGLDPESVDYVEAHGTGTSLGDPIELHALGASLAAGRAKDRPLLVGSVKTNLGHLEAAAGIAGFVKLALALDRERLPRQLHFRDPNPHVDWHAWPLEVVGVERPWPRGARPRRAGVSSFGFSGTNAHVVLEEAPAVDPPAPLSRPFHAITVSGRTPTALAAGARRLAAHLRGHPELALADVALTANAGRARLAERGAVVAARLPEAADELERLADGHALPGLRGRVSPGVVPEVVFLFPGQGAHYGGMARQLFETQPVVRDALERCDAALRGELQRPLLDAVFDPAEATLEDMSLAQPALFAVEYALSELWRSWGVRPAAVLGHSAGELVAACVAGVLSLEDAVRLIAARGRLMQSLPPGGAMATIFAGAAAVEEAMAREGGALTLAAVNGPEHVVVSGETARVERVLAGFLERGVNGKRLRISNAYHSPLVEPILDELERLAAGIPHHPPEVELISNLTGRAVAPGEAGAAYWREHMRRPVQFLASVRTLEQSGYRVFLEVGPGSTLLGIAQETIEPEGRLWLPTIRRSRDEWQQLLETAAALHVGGVAVDWAAADRPHARGRVALPTYPFERERCWTEVSTRPSEPSRSESTWDAGLRAGRAQAAQAPLDLSLRSFSAAWRAFDRLTTEYQLAALSELGAFGSAGERRTVEALCEELGIGIGHVPLLRRWLKHLSAVGYLRVEGDGYVADRPLPPEDVATARADSELSVYPEMLAYVDSCGPRLAAVLTGRESPLETLFPGGSFALTSGLYETSPVSRYLNGIVRGVIESVVRAGGGEVRLLEIGAGTGGTTSAVLPVLPPDRTSYSFTDVSDLFLSQAQDKFAAFPFVRYGRFDLERDPAEQGYAGGSFDVILAANVLHATRDLRRTLERVRALVAPGGLLVLSETTTHHRVYDVTTGLIEGWEVFADDVRGDDPLVSTEQWLRLLAKAGFEHVAALPEPGGPADVLGNRIIIGAASPTGVRAAEASGAQAGVAGAHSAATPPGPSPVDESLLAALAEALPSEREGLLAAHVRRRVMEVLRLDTAHTPGLEDRLMQLGFDSLMAMQLRNRLASDLGLATRLPATLVFDHPTCRSLGTFLAGRLDTGRRTATPEAPPARPETGVNVEALSDEQAEALLLKRLDTIEGSR
jgi:acyl transferase domain-containing protein/SAM-dependent methyltransferase